MLKEFSIKNFKSINEEVTLSMDADFDRVSEYQNHIINIRNNHLLRLCSMYGPNGGGKSNILKAISFLKRIVMDGTASKDSGDFSYAFSSDKISEFTAFFTTNKYDIGYTIRFKLLEKNADLLIDDRGFVMRSNPIEIVDEAIYYLNSGEDSYIKLISRDVNGKIESSYKPFVEATKIFNQQFGSSTSVIRFFYSFFYNNIKQPSNELEIIFDLYNEINSISSISSNEFLFFPGRMLLTPKSIDIIRQNKDKLIKLLDAADIKIKDIKIVKSSEGFYKVFFVRNIVVDNEAVEKQMNLCNESLGTQKLFKLLTTLIISKDKNLIFLGDDLNAFLHPKLLSAIIQLFANNDSKSQLIFNSHDITNMSNKVFRRDEIWFVYRDEKYQTIMIPLSNILDYKGKQIRNDAIYGKQYLEGKYGADPFVKKGLDWNE